MKSIFIIKRKDGKTDNIYECDFKAGKFVGGACDYTYEDIETFFMPTSFIKSLTSVKKQVKKSEEGEQQ